MAQDDIYTTALLQQHGTGLHTRADEAGNHAMAAGLMDSYAQAGRTVPAHMQPALRELNDLTQREVVLANASPSARVALGGSGYNPAQVRSRVAELEQMLYAESADVRNLGARLDLERQQQQVLQMELANQFTAATQQGRIDDQLATYAMNRQQNLSQLNAAEQSALVQQLSADADANGVTLEAMTEAWQSNDPALMKSIFGTSSRDVAHAMLTNRMAMNDEVNAGRVAEMASTINLRATEIAADMSISDADLQGMIAGDLPMPDGANMFTLSEALGKRAVRIEAQAALLEAEAQGLVKGAEYEQLVLDSQSPHDLAASFAQLFSQSGMAQGPNDPNAVATDMLRAMNEGRVADVAQAISVAMQSIGSDGYVEIPTGSGSTARIQANKLLNAIMEKTQRESARVGQQLLQNQRFQAFSAELAETDKQLRGTAALFGRPLPATAQEALRVRRNEAMRLMELAAAEPDAAKQAELTAAAGDVMQQARKEMAASIRAYGGSPGLVEDIEAGRFVSERNHKEALIGAVGYGDAGPRAASPLGELLNELVRDKKLTPREFQEWAEDGSKGLADLGITPDQVFEVIDGINYQVLANSAMDVLTTDPRFSNLLVDQNTGQLEPWVESALGPLMDGSLAQTRDLTPGDVLNRVMEVVRVVDEVAKERDLVASRAAGAPPSYQSGAIMQAVQDNMMNSGALVNYMTNGAGTPSREMGAFMAEILHFYDPNVPVAGEGSVQFEDMAEQVAALSLQRYNNAAAGRQLTSLAGMRTRAKQDASRALLTSGIRTGEGMTDDWEARQSALEIAVLGVYADKLSDPDAFRSTLFGVPLWSRGMSDFSRIQVPLAGNGYYIADYDQIRAKLREQGQNPDAILGEQ